MKIESKFTKTLSYFLSAFIFVLLSTVIFGAITFFVTYEDTAHASELAFIENSSDTSLVGSVVPASCESSPPTNHGIPNHCPPPPQPSYISPDCNPQGTNVVISWQYVPSAIGYAFRANPPYTVYNTGATAVNFTPVQNTNSSTWVHTYNIVDGAVQYSGATSAPFNCTSLYINSFTATPTNVDVGGASTLNWTVTDAVSCVGSGGWSGSKNNAGGSEVVYPPSTPTTYTLTCTNSTGVSVSNSVTVTTPAGYLDATNCTIPAGGVSCLSNVSWTTSNFLGVANVTQGSVPVGSGPSGGVIQRSVTPSDNMFTLSDVGYNFTVDRFVTVNCSGTEQWAGNVCVPAPIITLDATPNLVRSGSSAQVVVTIDSISNLECEFNDGGGLPLYSFIHTASPLPTVYPSITTRTLTSAQDVVVTCTSPSYPAVTGSDTIRLNVIPTFQEI